MQFPPHISISIVSHQHVRNSSGKCCLFLCTIFGYSLSEKKITLPILYNSLAHTGRMVTHNCSTSRISTSECIYLQNYQQSNLLLNLFVYTLYLPTLCISCAGQSRVPRNEFLRSNPQLVMERHQWKNTPEPSILGAPGRSSVVSQKFLVRMSPVAPNNNLLGVWA